MAAEEEFVCFGEGSNHRAGVINFISFAATGVKTVSQLLGLLAQGQFGFFECQAMMPRTTSRAAKIVIPTLELLLVLL